MIGTSVGPGAATGISPMPQLAPRNPVAISSRLRFMGRAGWPTPMCRPHQVEPKTRCATTFLTEARFSAGR
jgi:hypothetical protein